MTLHAKTDPLQKNAGQYAGNGASARHFLRLSWAQKIGKIPYIKSTDCPLVLPGGIW